MTTYNEIGWKKTIAPLRIGLTTFRNYWAALLEWREREKLRANLYDLSDRELHDIGIARDQIEYFVSNRFIDPRGVVYPP